MLSEYFEYQLKYEKEYGKEYTVVFMQNGKFFECYTNKSKTKGAKLDTLSEILDMQIANKKGKTDDTDVYMLGFPTPSLNKHKKILVSLGWTLIIIEQVTPPPMPIRKVTGIYSPATSENKLMNNNNIVSIFINNDETILSIGLSVLDLMTGKSLIHETFSTKNDLSLGTDETLRWLITYDPKEILLHLTYENYDETVKNYDKDIASYIKHFELENKIYYIKKELPEEYFKLKKQNEFFKKIWKSNIDPIDYLGLSKLKNGIVSYIMCLKFAIDHNENIVNRLPKPEIYIDKNVLILDNNAPLQLNLIVNEHLEYGVRKGKKLFKCVYDVVNRTITSIGKRLLHELMLSPFTDSKIIEERINYLGEIKKHVSIQTSIDKELVKICDMPKYNRKILMGVFHPSLFIKLDQSYKALRKILNLISNNEILKKIKMHNFTNKFDMMIQDYEKAINIDVTKLYNLDDIKRSIFNKNFDENIDKYDKILQGCDDAINGSIKIFNSYLDYAPDKSKKNSEKKRSKKKSFHDDSKDCKDGDDADEEDESKIKLCCNERDGYFLEIPKKYAIMLQENMDKLIIITDKITVNKKDIKIKERVKGKSKLSFPKLDEIFEKKIEYEAKMKDQCNKSWIEYLQKFYIKYEIILLELVNFAGLIDVLCSGAKIATEFNYIKPIIKHNCKNSYIKATGLRHPIVEQLCIDSEYVPHNIDIGNDIVGNIIMGFNGVGKSVFMKSIGISVILAQMGYFVPATAFELAPYECILARITGNDNFHKGQSSYVLEMTELSSILRRANNKSLIVGDEVCRGTDWVSGTGVVAATIEILSERNASFIFASHLHKLAEFDRIQSLKNIEFFHLTVELKDNDIIYHRELVKGAGSSVYGDIVAKHIINDKNFTEKLNYYKNEIVGTSKSSKYNKNVEMEKCEICNVNIKNLLDTHHINFQSECSNGFSINKHHVKMNEKYNLVVLCKKCHCDVHIGEYIIKGWIETTAGRKLNYTKQNIMDNIDIDIVNQYKKLFNINDLGTEWSIKQTQKKLADKKIFIHKNLIKKIWFNKEL
jgi:DNA mismatch repair protein MutS